MGGFIKSCPQQIIAENTDWHFLDERRRLLLAGAQGAWNCRICGSGILVPLVSSMARAKIARNLS